jgi:hypothetical protein
MNKIHKFILIGIIGSSCFILLILYSYGGFLSIPGISSTEDDASKDEFVNDPQTFVENITLIVDYGGGNIDKWEDFNLTGDTTAFDALDKWCDVEYDKYGWGVYVQEINGVRNNYPNFWFFGVNGKMAPVGSSNYNLLDGDKVNWVYDETYHPS